MISCMLFCLSYSSCEVNRSIMVCVDADSTSPSAVINWLLTPLNPLSFVAHLIYSTGSRPTVHYSPLTLTNPKPSFLLRSQNVQTLYFLSKCPVLILGSEIKCDKEQAELNKGSLAGIYFRLSYFEEIPA